MCAKQGVRGNEQLAFVINRYIEGMVKNLSKYGGDIIKFVGDALIVMWPSAGTESNNKLNSSLMENAEENINLPDLLKKETIRKAIQCALEIQNHMHNMAILPGTTLSVKVRLEYPIVDFKISDIY